MPRLWPAFLGGVAALFAAFQFGYLCSRSEIGDLQADLYNARQREQALSGRVAALEAQGGAPAPERVEQAQPAEPDPPTQELEQTVARLERDVEAAERGRDAARREREAARREQRKLASEKTRLEGELARLREQVRAAQSAPKPPAPKVAARAVSPPPAKQAATSACPPLERPEFAILEAATPLARLGGRLRLEVEEQDSLLALRVGASRYVLGEPPQRFSYDCGGTDYVISVCEVERTPLAVAGRITPADAWQDACTR